MKSLSLIIIALLAQTHTLFGQTFSFDSKTLQEGDIFNTKQKILFKYSSREIESTSFSFLDSLSTFLKQNDSIYLEIGCHLNSKKRFKMYSSDLSSLRAKSIRDFLVRTGINDNRLAVAGYENKFPLIPEEEITKMSVDEQEVAYHSNMRTELKVTKIKRTSKRKFIDLKCNLDTLMVGDILELSIEIDTFARVVLLDSNEYCLKNKMPKYHRTEGYLEFKLQKPINTSGIIKVGPVKFLIGDSIVYSAEKKIMVMDRNWVNDSLEVAYPKLAIINEPIEITFSTASPTFIEYYYLCEENDFFTLSSVSSRGIGATIYSGGKLVRTPLMVLTIKIIPKQRGLIEISDVDCSFLPGRYRFDPISISIK